MFQDGRQFLLLPTDYQRGDKVMMIIFIGYDSRTNNMINIYL